MPAGGFVITGQIQLRGPANLRPIVSNLQRQLQGVNAQVNVQLPRGFGPQLGALTTQLNNLNKSISSVGQNRTAAANINQIGAAARTAARQTQQAKTAAFEFGEAVGQAARKFAAFSLAAGSIVSLITAIKEGVSAAVEFQHEMVRLEQVGGNVGNIIGGISKEISDLSTSLGVSSRELSTVATTLRQAGLSGEDTRLALRGIAESAVAPTFTDIENTVEGAIAAMQQFNIQAKDLRGVLGAINRVSADFAVESDDIVHAVRRSGGAFKAAGGDLNELIALFTSVRQTTRESAETIASGFNTIFARLQRPDTVQQLQQMGIQLRYTADEARAFGKTEGEFVGPYEAIRRLNAALGSVPPASSEYAAIVEEIGGFRQVSKVIPLIQQFSVAERAMGSALNGTTSLSQSNIIAQQSLMIQVSKLKEEFLDLFRILTGNKVLQTYAMTFLELARGAVQLAKALEPLVPLLATMAIAKTFQTVGLGLNKDFGRGLKAGARSNKLAAGGIVPGTGNADTVPAMLTPGEFVIRKSAAKSIGYANLASLNHYANGGEVQDTLSSTISKQAGDDRIERQKESEAAAADIISKLAKERGIILKNVVADMADSPRKFASGGLVNKKRAYAFDFDQVLADFSEDDAKRIDALKAEKKYQEAFGMAYLDPGAIDRSRKLPAADLAAKRSQQGNAVYVLTARSSGDQGGIKDAIAEFAKRNGIDVKEILTVGDRDDRVPGKKPGTTRKATTPEKKRFAIEELLPSYDEIKVYDDKRENLEPLVGMNKVKARQVRDSRRKYAFGGLVQRFADGGRAFRKERLNQLFPTSLVEDEENRGIAPALESMPVGAIQIIDDTSMKSADRIAKLKSEYGITVTPQTLSAITAAAGKLEKFEQEKQAPAKGQLYIPFGNDKIGAIGQTTIGLAGEKASFRNTKDVLKKVKNKAVADAISGFDRINMRFTRYAVSNDVTEDFSETIQGPVSSAIKGAFVGAFGDVVGPNISLSRSEVSSLEGVLFEKYIRALTQTPIGPPDNGSDSVWDFLGGLNPNSSINKVIYPSPMPSGPGVYLDGKINPAQATVDDSLMVKYMTSNIGKMLAATQKLAVGGKVRGNNVQRFAMGGEPTGTDTVPALLTPGEFVINREAAQRIGYNNLNRLNKYHLGGEIQRFQRGGRVFKYEAMDHTGKEVKKTIEASSPEEAQQLIRQQGLFVTKINEVSQGGLLSRLFGRRPTSASIPTPASPAEPPRPQPIPGHDLGPQSRAGIMTRGLRPGSTAYKEARARGIAGGDVAGKAAAASYADRTIHATPQAESNNPVVRVLNQILNAVKDGDNKVARAVGQGGAPGVGVSPDVANDTPGTGFRGRVKRYGTAAAVLGAQYLPQLLQSGFGSTEKPSGLAGGIAGGINSMTGNTASAQGVAKYGAAAAGAASGAAAGIATGALFGPIGAAIGGVAGGLIGLVDSLNQAEREIRAINFQTTLKKFNLAIERASNTEGALTSDSLGNLRQGIENIRKAASQEADPQQFYAQNLPRESISRLQERLIKDVQFTPQDDTADERINKFLNAADGLGRSLVNLQLEADNISFNEISAQLDQITGRAAYLQNRDRQEKELSVTLGKQNRNFDRLNQAIVNATLSISQMQTQLDSTFAISQGQAASIPVPDFAAELKNFGSANTKRFDTAINFLTNAIGDGRSSLVEEFNRTAKGINSASSVLPTALQEVLSRGATGGDVGASLRTALKNTGADIPGEVQDALAKAITSFTEFDDENLFKNIASDVNKFADDLSKKAFPNVISVLEEAPKQLVDRFRQLDTDLARHQDIGKRIGESESKAGQAVVELIKAQSSILGRRVGAPRDQRENLPIAVTDLPFRQGLEGLTGRVGGDALNPRILTQELRGITTQIQEAASRRDAALARPSGGGREEAFQASVEFADLSAKAGNLQEALGRLADSASRTAEIQTRLANIQQQETSRLSAAEDYLTSSISDRAKMERAANMAQVAASQGNLVGFGPTQISEIFGVLKKFENIPIRGQFTGGDVREFLLRNDPRTAGLANLPAGVEGERQALENELLNRMDAAVEAQNGLTAFLSDSQSQFFDRLASLHNNFFAALQRNLLEAQATDTVGLRAKAQGDVVGLQSQQQAAQRLSGQGIDDYNKYRNLIQSPSFQTAREAASARSATSSVIGQASKGQLIDERSLANLKDIAGRVAVRRDTTVGIDEFGNTMTANVRTADPEQINRLSTAIVDSLTGRLGDKTRGQINTDVAAPVIEQARQAANQGRNIDVQDAINQQIYKVYGEASQTQNKAYEKAAADLRDASGLTIAQINTFTANFEQINKDLESLQGFGAQADLDTKVKAATSSVETLTGSLNTLYEKINGINQRLGEPTVEVPALPPAPARAGGGFMLPSSVYSSIFKPRGTDTVPAMLSPGEFVVNAASAKANASLLSTINDAKGAIYRATGGFVDRKKQYIGADGKPLDPASRPGWESLTPQSAMNYQLENAGLSEQSFADAAQRQLTFSRQSADILGTTQGNPQEAKALLSLANAPARKGEDPANVARRKYNYYQKIISNYPSTPEAKQAAQLISSVAAEAARADINAAEAQLETGKRREAYLGIRSRYLGTDASSIADYKLENLPAQPKAEPTPIKGMVDVNAPASPRGTPAELKKQAALQNIQMANQRRAARGMPMKDFSGFAQKEYGLSNLTRRDQLGNDLYNAETKQVGKTGLGFGTVNVSRDNGRFNGDILQSALSVVPQLLNATRPGPQPMSAGQQLGIMSGREQPDERKAAWGRLNNLQQTANQMMQPRQRPGTITFSQMFGGRRGYQPTTFSQMFGGPMTFSQMTSGPMTFSRMMGGGPQNAEQQAYGAMQQNFGATAEQATRAFNRSMGQIFLDAGKGARERKSPEYLAKQAAAIEAGKRRREELAALENEERNKKAKGYALGGPARGSDVVPAMLTPGEFVVSRDSARSNMGLLTKINSSKRPIYRAAGGPVGAPGVSAGGGLPSMNLSQEGMDALRNFTAEFGANVNSLSAALGQFATGTEALNGVVSGMQELIGPLNLFAQNVQLIRAPFDAFNTSATNLGAGMALFNRSADALSAALNNLANLPSTITVQGTTQVNVVVTGAEAFGAMRDQMQAEIAKAVAAKLKPEITADLKNGALLA